MLFIKIYSSILNTRMLEHAERENIIADEQNGLRKNRSWVDDIFKLNSVIKTRLNENKPPFVAFIDFEKAFNFVNRDLLIYRVFTLSL